MTIGNVIYYLAWPLIWFYSPLTARVRVIIRNNNEILVVKNWFGSGQWDLPGGGIKIGEKPLETASREIQEELGISLIEPKLLTEETLVHRQFGLLKRNHFVLSDMGTVKDISTSREISQYKWVSLEDFSLPKQIASKL